MRAQPSLQGTLLVCIPDGSTVAVLAGSVAVDGFQWQRISFGGQIGWSVELYLQPGASSPPPAATAAPPPVVTVPPSSPLPTPALTGSLPSGGGFSLAVWSGGPIDRMPPVTAQRGCTLRAVHTPGHAANHVCWLLEEEALLFTGDHVMQGSTVVINPPDGDMAAYLASLRRLLELPLDWFAPGHGFLMAQPHTEVRRLVAHRLAREAKVLEALRALGPCTDDALVPTVYGDVPAARHGLALRSLRAHLGLLLAEGRVREQDGLLRVV